MLMFSRFVFALAVAPFFPTIVSAQPTPDFYSGKVVNLHVGYTVGGGYDVYARLLARYIGKHIPGQPTVTVNNMPGAGSLRLANWIYSAAPADGTAFGTIGRGIPFDQLLGRPGIQFESQRFTWIGSMNDEVSVCVSMASSGVKSFDELKHKPLIVGAAGAGNDADVFARVINTILGTKMQIITAYPGGNEVVLAMERGEIEGRCGWSWSSIKAGHPSWLSEKKIHVLVQLGLNKHSDLPDVPLITELAKTDHDRRSLALVFARQSLGRPFLGPPGIPKERAAILRSAFMKTLAENDLRNEGDRRQIELVPISGEQVENIINKVFSETTPELAKSVGALLLEK